MNNFWDGDPTSEVEMDTLDKNNIEMERIPSNLAKSIIMHFQHLNYVWDFMQKRN